ncbi:acid phosphatase [Viridibacterium curvum]|uniref:Phosphatase PAP2 family protein n=1 Tax=Viridibacterium curvum TaxID=1101404 RepID=A0ABP9QTT5_9RHOO
MHAIQFRPHATALAVLSVLALAACGGNGSSAGNENSSAAPLVIPAEPVGTGAAETADAPTGVLAYVDTGATNQRNNPCQVTLETNAGVRVLKGFLDMWEPLTRKVDAGVTLAAANGCDAVTASLWSGVPGTTPDGTVTSATLHAANIDYVKSVTQGRTVAQALAAYMDDRRGKGFSVSDGMGPLTSVWRAGTGQTSTIVAPADPNAAVSPAVSEAGNNLGDKTSAALAQAVSFIDSSNIVDGSTEPAKRFYKYARPYRWSSDVVVVPSLESAKSSTPATDGGFPSGHTAEAWRDVLPMAYLFPQRFQELLTRAMEMGENRILAGMHSPLDVMGGRVQATAVVAYSLNKTSMDKAATYKLVQDYLMAQTGTSDFNALLDKARTPVTSDTSSVNYDRFADYATNKSYFAKRLTYNLPKITANAGKAATVPKGAEILLETRLPYLTAAQRRVVLKTTEIDSGYPLANDEEGWGRLDLFSAADGYGAFNGDVAVTMDASLGGFHARDSWKNDIAGAGKLSKLGSGMLRLAGSNSYSGGTLIVEGTLAADSVSALGKGDVFMKGGKFECAAPGALLIGGAYTQTAGILDLVLSDAAKGVLKVSGTATLGGGSLQVRFAGYTPKLGDTLNVITAGKLAGSFSSVSVSGFSKITTTYTATGVQIRLDGV